MILRIIPFVLIFCIGCRTTSKTNQISAIAENNKDVVVLAYLIRDYMRSTGSTDFNLSDILENDTLHRVTKNFSKLEIVDWPNIWRGGYAIYFKFSDERNIDTVELLPTERIPWKIKEKKAIGRNKAQLDSDFDGVIHFHYPERFYHIAEIVLKERANE